MERLETPRLWLEPLAPRHADALHALYADPAVSRFLIARARSRHAFGEIFNRALRFGASHGMWAVFSRQDHALIGRVGFFAFGDAARPELAFLLGASAWGRGLATEASARALQYALECHPWNEVVAVVRPANRSAARVLEKLGFSVESTVSIGAEPARLYQASREELRKRERQQPE